MIVQLSLWDERPEPTTLCDTCRRLVWHANGDGYCCCTAPGMWGIDAKNRKPFGTQCKFFEKRSD